MEHRNNLRQAIKLLGEAGWTIKSGQLMNAKGEILKAEFLLVQADFERIVLPYIDDLKSLILISASTDYRYHHALNLAKSIHRIVRNTRLFVIFYKSFVSHL